MTEPGAPLSFQKRAQFPSVGFPDSICSLLIPSLSILSHLSILPSSCRAASVLVPSGLAHDVGAPGGSAGPLTRGW